MTEFERVMLRYMAFQAECLDMIMKLNAQSGVGTNAEMFNRARYGAMFQELQKDLQQLYATAY